MSRLSFDTHAAIRKLEQAGCPAEQAEAMVAIVTEATGLTAHIARGLRSIRLQVETNMATKDDLAALRAETHEGLAGLRSELKGDVAELRADGKIDIAEHRAETRSGFAEMRERLGQLEERMVTKGELYRALWIQGGVLATLILSLAAITMGFALYVMTGS